MLHVIVAHHPLGETPYNKLHYVGADAQGTPLYDVMGASEVRYSASKALRAAFALYGGQCYYCRTSLKPAAASITLDHVVAKSAGGTDLLHNLVIACPGCNKQKGAKTISEFRPEVGKAYHRALERHIADAILSAAGAAKATAAKPSAPPPPKRDAAGGP